jgi:protein-tyrosine phosphatase
MASMRNWIQGPDVGEDVKVDGDGEKKKRVAVVHCKAGKGRSGTSACSYLISEEGWSMEDALQRFTTRRMRPGFGLGVSIPSQLRWVGYVDRWTTKMGKKYIERPVEILEVHVWGLRDGVKVEVEGYIDGGKRIRTFHTFTRQEKTVVEEHNIKEKSSKVKEDDTTLLSPTHGTPRSSTSDLSNTGPSQTVILKPTNKLILPTSDVNVDFERRNKAGYTGLTMVTAIAHVWFNAYFEGGHEGHDSGVFEIDWDAMDGIKGSSRKGTRALDRLKVVWRYANDANGAPLEKEVIEPAKGEPVPEAEPANWQGEEDEEFRPADGVDSGRKGGAAITMGAMIDEGAESISRELGLRKSHTESANVSRASSVKAGPVHDKVTQAEESEDEGTKPWGPEGESEVHHDDIEREDTKAGHAMEAGLAKIAHTVAKMKPSEKNEAKRKGV